MCETLFSLLDHVAVLSVKLQSSRASSLATTDILSNVTHVSIKLNLGEFKLRVEKDHQGHCCCSDTRARKLSESTRCVEPCLWTCLGPDTVTICPSERKFWSTAGVVCCWVGVGQNHEPSDPAQQEHPTVQTRAEPARRPSRSYFWTFLRTFCFLLRRDWNKFTYRFWFVNFHQIQAQFTTHAPTELFTLRVQKELFPPLMGQMS